MIYVIRLRDPEGPDSMFVVSAEDGTEAIRQVRRACERIDIDPKFLTSDRMRIVVEWDDPNEFFIIRESHHGPMLENLEEG